jgi:cytochrome c oxidase assembly protein subunit 15
MMRDPANEIEGGGGGAADVLAVGFGTTVAMWAVGYVSRALPALVPAWAVLAALVPCLLAGGFVLGRFGFRGQRGALRGAGVGLVAGVLNLLILGSFLGEREHRAMLHWAAVWLPVSLVTCMGLTLLGALAGAATREDRADRTAAGAEWWTFVLAVVTAAATFVLVIAGGLVTGFHAGLSVPDWPTSFHMNMFLYPLARMTGGVYYEHAHRLYGTLVGLTTLALAVQVWRTDRRPWMHRVLLVAVLAVIAQGIMGGLRVTGAAQPGVELSTPHDETARSVVLAVAHGVFGQMFLGLMTAVAVFCTPRWRQAPLPASRHSAGVGGTDRLLTAVALAAVLGQLVLGAIQRQTQRVLLLHIVFAAVTAALVLSASVRAWGLHAEVPLLPRLGLLSLGLLLLQLLLGVAAMVTRIAYPPAAVGPAVISTLHQAGGAALLVAVVLLHLWTARLLGG